MKKKKATDKQLWEYKEHHKRRLEEGLTVKEYTAKYGLCPADFKNKINRINYNLRGDTERYQRIYDAVKTKVQGGVKHGLMPSICNELGISYSQFSEMRIHIRYTEAIKRYEEKLKQDKPPMNFVDVTPNQQIAKQEEQPEVLEPKNDIEIIITKGVKVIISPNIDSMKIIKIIELLKEM